MFARSFVAVCFLITASGYPLPALAVSLDVPVRASFERLPLRVLLSRLGDSTGTLLVLNRQIDPNQPVSLAARGEPLHAVLDEIATLVSADVATLAESAWLVPPGEATRYEATDQLRQNRLAHLPKYIQKTLLKEAKLQWAAGVTPRELINELIAEAKQHHLTISLPELHAAIPHDHLPAASLPPLTLAERFDLVAMQYGHRVDWSRSHRGQQVAGRLLPLPDASAAIPTRTRPVGPSTAQRHQPAAANRRRFTLRAAAPLTNLIDTVAAQYNLEPAIDITALRQQGVDPQSIVRLEVTDADRDELLTAIVSPLKLTWSIRGTRLIVTTPPAGYGIKP